MNKNQVLKQRTITGLIFGIIVLGLFFSGKVGVEILAWMIALFSCFEYVRMIYPGRNEKKTISIIITSAIIIYLRQTSPDNIVYYNLTIIACISLISGILNMYRPFISHQKFYWLVSILYFGLPLGLFISFIRHAEGYAPGFWIAVISMIWMSDSFAYLVGSRIGKTKLFEKISPKKSWEGFIGAGVFTLPLAFVAGHYFLQDTGIVYGIYADNLKFDTGWFWVLIASLAWIVGTLGDLVESSIKRIFNIKDSGNILPGHGGILDRFDSFIYILPFVLLLLLQFSKI